MSRKIPDIALDAIRAMEPEQRRTAVIDDGTGKLYRLDAVLAANGDLDQAQEFKPAPTPPPMSEVLAKMNADLVEGLKRSIDTPIRIEQRLGRYNTPWPPRLPVTHWGTKIHRADPGRKASRKRQKTARKKNRRK